MAAIARTATTTDVFDAVAEPRRLQILDVLAAGAPGRRTGLRARAGQAPDLVFRPRTTPELHYDNQADRDEHARYMRDGLRGRTDPARPDR